MPSKASVMVTAPHASSILGRQFQYWLRLMRWSGTVVPCSTQMLPICILILFAKRWISYQHECGRLRERLRGISTLVSYLHGPHSSHTLIRCWHWSGCVKLRDETCWFFSLLDWNKKWWMARLFNDVVVERRVLKQAHYTLTAVRWGWAGGVLN